MSPRTVTLLVLGLVMLVYGVSGVLVGRYGDGKRVLRREDDPVAFRVRAALLMLASVALLLMAGKLLDGRVATAAGGAALLACSMIAMARGQTVLYRGRPQLRAREPLIFWLHVGASIAAAVLVLSLALRGWTTLPPGGQTVPSVKPRRGSSRIHSRGDQRMVGTSPGGASQRLMPS